MTWDELLTEFRALGGVAENVRLGTGPYGRGLFAVDPSKPVNVFAPHNLMVRSGEIEVRNGMLCVSESSAMGQRERAFFENLQRDFGWGPGLGFGEFEEVRRAQQAWHELPADVIDAVGNIGGLEDPEKRFLAPSLDICLYQYLRCRYFSFRDATYIAPLIDLANHSDAATPFAIGEGIGIVGRFADEVFVRYGGRDPWANAMTYGFTEPSTYAYSLKIDVDVFGKRLSIGRTFAEFDMRDGVRMPRVKSAGNAIEFPYLTLGIASAPDAPRAIFRNAVQSWLTQAQADDTFDSIARFNRVKFVNVLRALRRHDGPLIALFEAAALDQLEGLANCVGARSL